LLKAVRNSEHDVVELLLADCRIKLHSFIEKVESDETLQLVVLELNALQYASFKGDLEMVRLLIQHIDPSAPTRVYGFDEPNYATFLAIKHGHLKIVLIADPCVALKVHFDSHV